MDDISRLDVDRLNDAGNLRLDEGFIPRNDGPRCNALFDDGLDGGLFRFVDYRILLILLIEEYKGPDKDAENNDTCCYFQD